MASSARLGALLLSTLLGAATLAAQASTARDQARIALQLRLAPAATVAQVEMRIEGIPGAELTVAMPVWKPGSYTRRDFARGLRGLTAASPDGEPLTVVQPDPSSWTIASKGCPAVIVRYELPLGRNQGLGSREREEGPDGPIIKHPAYCLEGPATWLYVKDRLDVPCTVRFDLPEDCDVATGLARTDDPRAFTAPDYDVLADCPLHLGRLERLEFAHDGVPYEISLAGFEEDASDRRALVERWQAIVRAAHAMMGKAPFERYVFLIGFPGGSGLEHLNSTNITMMTLAGSTADDDSLWDSIVAHEFFHLWNVKRLRPRALGPFDYADVEANRTRYLWLAEGVTSYYGDLLCVRAGLWDEERYWTRGIAQEINTLQSNPGRRKMSVAEASWTVWDAPYMRRGSTAPDYYNKGQLLGLLLDVEIRDATDGERSLDDVMRGLYEQCRANGQGFADGDVQAWCEKVSGQAFTDFFARYVEGTDELPYEAVLARIGVKVTPPKPAPESEPAAGTPPPPRARGRGRWRVELDPEAPERAARLRAAITARVE